VWGFESPPSHQRYLQGVGPGRANPFFFLNRIVEETVPASAHLAASISRLNPFTMCYPKIDGRCLYIEAMAEFGFHMEMKMSSWCFFCRSKAPAWSLQAQLRTGESIHSLFPVSAERGQGLPHPQPRKWHRPLTSHSEETPGRPKGEAEKQRASEPPFFSPLSLARASMKIWCFRKRNTAIKWRENATKLEPSLHLESCFSGIQLLVVEEPSPLGCVAYNIYGVIPTPLRVARYHLL
jgi:hypothetical protein